MINISFNTFRIPHWNSSKLIHTVFFIIFNLANLVNSLSCTKKNSLIP